MTSLVIANIFQLGKFTEAEAPVKKNEEFKRERKKERKKKERERERKREREEEKKNQFVNRLAGPSMDKQSKYFLFGCE